MQEELQNHDDLRDREEEKKGIAYQKLVNSKRITFSDIREHISGPVISIMFHVFLILFFATIIVIKKPEEPEEPYAVMRDDLKIPDIEKINDLPKPKVDDTKEDINIERPDVVVKDVEVKINDVPVKSDLPVDIPKVLNVRPNNSPTTIPMPPNMPNRTPEKIDEITPPGTNDAVLRGLHWLKDHQNDDGSWGDSAKNNFAAYTGMALLAFLAHGETPTSKEFGPTVEKAIKKLVEMVGPEADKVKGGYRHAIAMYALSEAYAMTEIPMLKDIVTKGITRIIKGMNSDGSFDYGYKKGGRSDLSVAGWNYQALKAAYSAGFEIEGLEAAIDKAVNKGLKETHYDSAKKMFCYGAGSGPKSTMTAVGVLCLQFYGEEKSKEAKKGLRTLKSKDHFWFSWNHPKKEEPPVWALYQWYYQTQAFFQATKGKGQTWKRWDKMFSTELMKRQKEDGRWETPAFEHNPVKGGHGEAMFKGLDQPVYATTLCCLMLEVYYRYLPTFQVPNVEIPDGKNGEEGKDEDDLGLFME